MANNNEPNFWDKTKDFFSGIWDWLTGDRPVDNTNNESDGTSGETIGQKNYHEREELKSDAIGYAGAYIKPKTFDEWLSDQKLSRDEQNENYFGNFYKKTAKSLLDQAYTNKTNATNSAEVNASRAGTASHNAYKVADSNYSNASERMSSSGLSNSGFSNYLKGISYLAYRDELAKNTNSKIDAISKAESNYSNTSNQIEQDKAKQISDREQELLKLYLDSVNKNKDVIFDLAK